MLLLSSESLLREFTRHKLTAMTDIKQLLKEFELPFKMHETSDAQQHALKIYRTHPKATQLVTLLTLIGDGSEGLADPLGELYQQAISNGHNGQFWTPEHMCDMMATITIGETLDDNQAVCDPTCGSGRMLLATAKINRKALFYGADLDITCCKMTLLNMLLNSLQGEVAHMNTLSNDFYKGYKISTTLVNRYHMPYYIEFDKPELSYIWLRPVKQRAKPAFTTPFEPVRAS
jgi:type I restriction enzyme M protein